MGFPPCSAARARGGSSSRRRCPEPAIVHRRSFTGIRSPVFLYRYLFTGISITGMVRTPLTPWERERGERLGVLLRTARGERSMVEIAAAAGLSAETLRKIETGRAPTPAVFTVAALAGTLGLSLDVVA